MSNRRLVVGISCAAWLGTVQLCQAQTANMPFTAAVLSTCTIVIATPGVMAPNSDFTVLDSEESGGTSGVATVTTTDSAFSISVDAPTTFFDAPTGGNDNVAFAAKYSATGATSASDVVGTVTTLINPGVTSMEVDVTATKSSGVFTQGAYAATATVRCE